MLAEHGTAEGKQWWATGVLFAVYVAVFNAWRGMGEREIRWLGAAVCAGLAALLALAFARGYFTTAFDLAAHAVVVLDLGLEAWLIEDPASHGFVLCAVAFVAVVGGYRGWKLRHPCACTFNLGKAG
jgi:hypothetical protein